MQTYPRSPPSFEEAMFGMKLIPIINPVNAKNAVKKAANIITKNFPRTISNLLAGDERMVSRVPLSFSPDPRSKNAGYIAPKNPNRMKIYGNQPPIKTSNDFLF